MQISSRLTFDGSKALFNISSALSLAQNLNNVSFKADSLLYALSDSYSFGQGNLLAVLAIGGAGSLFSGYGLADAQLTKLVTEGSGGLFVPSSLQQGSSEIPSLFTSGLLKTSSPGLGLTSIVSLASKGSDINFGEGSSSIPGILSSSLGALASSNYIASISSALYATSGSEGLHDAILFISSTGRIIDTILGTKEYLHSIIESLNTLDSFSLIGSYYVTISESLVGSGLAISTSENGASLNTSSRVWVVNLETSSSAQYENYSYNSFFERDGKYYGVADDGIYLLDGPTDNGSPIDSLVEFGRSDFGLPAVKSIPNVYIGVASSNSMYIKVETDDNTYIYKARSNSPHLKTHRLDVGKGLKGNYYNFTLMNNSGCDFELESISFSPIQLSRKI